MNIPSGNKWLSTQNINLNLTAESELETIEAMLELVDKSGRAADIKILAEDLLHHEVLEPTHTGNCALIFHILSPSVIRPGIFFGRFVNGIGYYSESGHPIGLVFLVVAPPKMKTDFLSVMEKIKSAMNQPDVRKELRRAKTPEAALKILGDVTKLSG